MKRESRILLESFSWELPPGNPLGWSDFLQLGQQIVHSELHVLGGHAAHRRHHVRHRSPIEPIFGVEIAPKASSWRLFTTGLNSLSNIGLLSLGCFGKCFRRFGQLLLIDIGRVFVFFWKTSSKYFLNLPLTILNLPFSYSLREPIVLQFPKFSGTYWWKIFLWAKYW